MDNYLIELDLSSINPMVLGLFKAFMLIIIFMLIVGVLLRTLHVPNRIVNSILGIGTVILLVYIVTHYGELNFN